MPRVKSAKGKVIDFDLLKIKRQMAGKPVSIDVKARQNFIDQKARRRIRKITQKAVAAAGIDVDSEVLAAVQSTPTKPMIDAPKPAPQVVDVTAQPAEEKQTKQKIRPPKES
jgi:hypothetical protein